MYTDNDNDKYNGMDNDNDNDIVVKHLFKAHPHFGRVWVNMGESIVAG